ncbi:hypothetical protein JZ903_05085 [Riemerella anatipestifer]
MKGIHNQRNKHIFPFVSWDCSHFEGYSQLKNRIRNIPISWDCSQFEGYSQPFQSCRLNWLSWDCSQFEGYSQL